MLKRYLNSLSGKLTFLYTITTAMILILIVVASYWVVNQIILTAEKQFIVDEVNVIEGLLQQYNKLSALTYEVNAVPEALKSAKFRYYVRIYNLQNDTLMQTPDMNKLVPDPHFPALDVSNWQQHWIHWQSKNGRHFVSMTAPLRLDKNGEPILLMQMAFDGTYPEGIINNYKYFAIIFLLISITLIAFAGKSITKRGLKQLYHLINVTEKITTEDLTERIDNKNWPQELIPLSESLNEMLERIESGFKRLSDCSIELAHELRTPINNLMLATEISLSRSRTVEDYQQVLISNIEEYKRLVKIIESVLFLSRAANNMIEPTKNLIDLQNEIQNICDYYTIVAAEYDLSLSSNVEGHLNVDLILFQRVMSNLLTNAIQHTPRFGSIEILCQQQSHATTIHVIDSGLGISKEHIDNIFSKFYRINQSGNIHRYTTGVGFGLPIVKLIVELHGGQVKINSQPNKGTCVSLVFPKA